jgi:hypothetical protein
MVENTDANGLSAALHDRDDGLPTDRGVSRPVEVAFSMPPIRHGRSGQASGAGRSVPRIIEWSRRERPSGSFIGAGALALGMAIHNKALAKPTSSTQKFDLLLRHGR